MYCFILLVSAARLSMAESNRRCTCAALQKNFAGISSFTWQQVRSLELIIISQIKGKHALIILPTGYRKSLSYQAAPDIASELAARGLVSGKERAL